MTFSIRLILSVILAMALCGSACGGENHIYADTIIEHAVEKGEVLGTIAEKYGTTVDSIKKWNNLSNDIIGLGKVLKIYKKVEVASLSAKDNDKSNSASSKKELKHDSIGRAAGENSENLASESSFSWIMLVIAIVGLAVCVLVRVRFWANIRNNKKDVFLVCATLLFVIVGALAWESVRHVFYWVIGIAAVVTIAVLIVKYVGFRKNSSTATDKLDVSQTKDADVNNRQLIDKLKKENEGYQRQIEQLKGEIEEYKRRVVALEKEKNEILDENIRLGEQIDATRYEEEKAEKRTVEENINAEKEAKKVIEGTKLYAESIIDGYLFRVKEAPTDDSVYELQIKGDAHATFTVYGKAERRVLANPSFLDGCECQFMGESLLKIIRQGEASLDDRGKWRVITTLLVHIE